MKRLSIFAALLISLPSLANPLVPFTGKFAVDTAHCPSVTFMGMKRVYIYPTRDENGLPVLQIDSYGSDAGLQTILLGKGSRQTPGTDPQTHGKVTDTWNTSVQGNVLELRGKTERPSIHQLFYWRTTLRANAKSVSWRQETADRTGEVTDAETCRFLR